MSEQMPTTPSGLERYDSCHAATAAMLAWCTPGINEAAHFQAMQGVRDSMPVLARALDRLPRAIYEVP